MSEDHVKHRHNLKGIKYIDDTLHVPVSEIISFCKRFALYQGKDLGVVLDQAVKSLISNPDKIKTIPVISKNKKSFFDRLFE